MSVYLIRPTICYEAGDWYIGSTKGKMKDRQSHHKCHFYKYKNEGVGFFISVFKLFEKYGVDNCEIIALETDIQIEQLKWRERFYIEKYKCINIVKRPITTREEYINAYRAKNAANRKKNKDYFKSYNKAYYEEKKDELRMKQKAYYEANREKIRQQQKDKRNAQKNNTI